MAQKTENKLVDTVKTICIPKSISVAALLLIEWMQEQGHCEELDIAEGRQTFVFKESLEQGHKSR